MQEIWTRPRQQRKWINADEDISMSDAEDLNMFTVGETSCPIMVEVKVNSKPLTMEVDTGAAVTDVQVKNFRCSYT